MSLPRDFQVRLARLKDRFIGGETAFGGDYWDSDETLAAYDATFGTRIGWKWDSVLAELKLRQWAPPPGSALVDFGCGSGVASRKTVEEFGAGHFKSVHLGDQSLLAVGFAARKLAAGFPSLLVRTATPAPQIPDEPFTLLVSHVLNELNPAERAALVNLASRAAAVIWVEPGTSDVAEMMVIVREELRATMNVVAPCTHCGECGLLTPGNERHWCHHFGKPPTVAFTDQFWTDFSRTMSVDLRSLPYSFLVLDADTANSADSTTASRVIGTPREYKGYSKLLVCSKEGVGEKILQRRDDPALFKNFDRTRLPLLYRFEVDGERIRSGAPWPDRNDPPASESQAI